MICKLRPITTLTSAIYLIVYWHERDKRNERVGAIARCFSTTNCPFSSTLQQLYVMWTTSYRNGGTI